MQREAAVLGLGAVLAAVVAGYLVLPIGGASGAATPTGKITQQPSGQGQEQDGDSTCPTRVPDLGRPDISVDTVRFTDTNTVEIVLTAHATQITLNRVALDVDGEVYRTRLDRPLPFSESTTVTVNTGNGDTGAFSPGQCASAGLSVAFDKAFLNDITVTADTPLQARAP